MLNKFMRWRINCLISVAFRFRLCTACYFWHTATAVATIVMQKIMYCN